MSMDEASRAIDADNPPPRKPPPDNPPPPHTRLSRPMPPQPMPPQPPPPGSRTANLARWFGFGSLGLSLPLLMAVMALLLAQEGASDGAIGLTGVAILVYFVLTPVAAICLVMGLLGAVLAAIVRLRNTDQPWMAAFACGLVGAVLFPILVSLVANDSWVFWDWPNW